MTRLDPTAPADTPPVTAPRRHRGKLELTWTNRDQVLLAHDPEIVGRDQYEWVDPADHRVAEVRLLDSHRTVGETHPDSQRARDNLLIRGDALHALTSLGSLDEFGNDLLGKVRLCYIDPPFNTGQAFTQYEDGLEHSIWLTMLRDRLQQVWKLLSDDGSVWVHLDDTEVHYCKVMMDAVFGTDCFVTAFIWRKVDSPNDNKVQVTPDHEYILCYTKKPGAERHFARKDDESILAAYGNADADGRRYRDRLLKKNGKNSLRGDRPTMWYPITGPDGVEVWPIHDDGREARWSLGRARVETMQKAGDLVWKERASADGGKKWVPYTREWAPEAPKRPWPSIWADLPTTRQAKAHLTKLFPGVTAFATPKPEQLLQRIVEIATRPGELVLDCFVGSGTTATVAHKMGRRWIAIERSHATIDQFVLPRLTSVVAGTDEGGITASTGWTGGGGFRVLDVHPSMFEVDQGRVVVAPWATGGALAEAVAAQASFRFEPDAMPFCGRKGKSRLAVIDGLLSPQVVDLLIAWLEPDEVLSVYGTALDPDVRARLAELRRGSEVKKIPQSILDDYRRSGSGRFSDDWPSVALPRPEHVEAVR